LKPEKRGGKPVRAGGKKTWSGGGGGKGKKESSGPTFNTTPLWFFAGRWVLGMLAGGGGNGGKNNKKKTGRERKTGGKGGQGGGPGEGGGGGGWGGVKTLGGGRFLFSVEAGFFCVLLLHKHLGTPAGPGRFGGQKKGRFFFRPGKILSGRIITHSRAVAGFRTTGVWGGRRGGSSFAAGAWHKKPDRKGDGGGVGKRAPHRLGKQKKKKSHPGGEPTGPGRAGGGPGIGLPVTPRGGKPLREGAGSQKRGGPQKLGAGGAKQ